MIHRAILLAPIALLAVTANSEGIKPRLRIRFDADWKFLRGPAEKPGTQMGPYAWEWKRVDSGSMDVRALPTDIAQGDWRKTNLGRNVLRNGMHWAWYRTELGSNAADAAKKLHFESVDDNAVIFLNGKLIGDHVGYGDEFDVSLSDAWKAGGPNTLYILIENTNGEGGINGGIMLQEPAEAERPAIEAMPGFDDARWRTVHLPHDYVVEGTFRQGEEVGHGSLPKPTAWYRKTFTVPATYKGKSIWIDFDGVYRNSTIYLNGEKLGTEPSGYIGFRYDIQDKLKYGQKNVLAVHTDPRQDEGWWYEGGGIYRHVWLNIADPVHIVPDTTFVKPTLQGDSANVTITGLATPKPYENPDSIAYRIFDSRGRKVGEHVTVLTSGRHMPESEAPHVGARQGNGKPAKPDAMELATRSTTYPPGKPVYIQLHSDIKVANPQLWSIEHPNLYRLVISVYRNNKLIDAQETNFGFRTIAFDKDKGFLLNGKQVKLKGTCNHQDHAGVGVAMPDGLLDWRIRKLKEMGSNAYRCSHNPPAQELIDACDRLGMVVMDETRHLGETTKPKSPSGTKVGTASELRRLVMRDRNHPSVIMWSLYNEEGLQGTTEGADIFVKERAIVDELDGTRPCSGATNFGYDRGIVDVTDLFGINYAIGVYDDVRKRKPNLPLFGSETASTVSTRGIYANDPARGYVSAYDLNHPAWAETAEHAWKPIAERDWMAGGFVWTGFDYKGEPTPYGWPCVNSHFGILDICGFPKDNFFYYKAWWGDQPIVHVLPHWNWSGKEGQNVSVWVQSNADEVELFVNGKSFGRKAMPRYEHLSWDVPYAAGAVEARGYRNGKLIAKDRVETTGVPVAIRLKTTRKNLLADNEDLSPVEVEIVDAKGRVVPTADNLVRFEVEGQGGVVGVGNGDPSDHDPDKATKRKAFNGLCMALVGAKGGAGKIVLTASAEGLKSATIEISTRKGDQGQ